MDTLFYFVLVEQMVANVALAAVIVVFGRTMTRALHANIEPCVRVDLAGAVDQCEMTVSNHSACEIVAVCLELSEINPLDGCDSHRRPIYSEVWDAIAPGASIALEKPLITAENLSLEALSGAGREIAVQCSFVRRADNRPFAYTYCWKLLEQPDGKITFAAPTAMRGSRRADAGPSRPRVRINPSQNSPVPHIPSNNGAAAAELSLGECIG